MDITMRYSLRKVSTFIQSSIRSAKEYLNTPTGQVVFPLVVGAGAACCVTAALPSAVASVPTLPFFLSEYARMMTIEGLSNSESEEVKKEEATIVSQLTFQGVVPILLGASAKMMVGTMMGPAGSLMPVKFLAKEKVRHLTYRQAYQNSDQIKGFAMSSADFVANRGSKAAVQVKNSSLKLFSYSSQLVKNIPSLVPTLI
jgi:hypothetical protein